jgi:hypothetical protein
MSMTLAAASKSTLTSTKLIPAAFSLFFATTHCGQFVFE